jgi:flagellar L-ring protein precursor FlgH
MSIKIQSTQFIILGAGLALATACLNTRSGREASNAPLFENPPVVRATEVGAEDPYQNDGSLFHPAGGRWSVWGDPVAGQIGDIITVRILVQHSARQSATTDLSRNSELSAGVGAFFGLEKSLPGVGDTDPLSGTSAEQLAKSEMGNSFNGKGSSERSGRIVADISAMVTHVYPNGNLQIQGSQSMKVNNEDSLLTVVGVVRPQDIARDNVVISDRIAQARIEMTGRGVISDKQRPGFLSRAVDWLWPL